MNDQGELKFLIERLRATYTNHQLLRHFIERTLDDELARIGKLVSKRKAPQHIYVFDGYNIVVQNEYALVKDI